MEYHYRPWFKVYALFLMPYGLIWFKVFLKVDSCFMGYVIKTSGSWCGVKGFIIFGICNNGLRLRFLVYGVSSKIFWKQKLIRLTICKKLLKHSWHNFLYLLVFAGWIRQCHTPWWHDPDTLGSVQIAPRLPGTLESVKQKFYLDTALTLKQNVVI